MARKTVRQFKITVNTLFGQEESWATHEPVQPAWKGLPGSTAKCSRCKVTKPATRFSPSVVNKSSLQSHCQDCHNLGQRLRWKTDAKLREESSHRHRTRRYGVDADKLAQMMAAQDGKCAICADPLKPGKATAVDHCHSTGKVRELLCAHCNVTLGFFEKKGNLFPAFARYVAKHSQGG